jgi:hypothetical protein
LRDYALFLPAGTDKDKVWAAIAQIGPIHFQEIELSSVTIPGRGNFVRVALKATNDGAYDRLCRNLNSVEP